MEPAVLSVTRVRVLTAKTPTQKFAVSKEGREETHSIKRSAILSDKQRMAHKSVRIPRCILHKERNHSHEDHVAVRGFHSWHHFNLASF